MSDSPTRLMRRAMAVCRYCAERRPIQEDSQGLFHVWRVRGGDRQEDCEAESIRRALRAQAKEGGEA